MVVRPIDDGQHEAVGDPVPVAADDSNGGVRRSTRERRPYKKYGQDYDYDVSEIFVPLKLAFDLVNAAAREKSAVGQKQPGVNPC